MDSKDNVLDELNVPYGANVNVNEGDKVKKGDTLLIVEAMKVMNNISSPKDGVIEEIYIENAQPVEYDQPLVVIK